MRTCLKSVAAGVSRPTAKSEIRNPKSETEAASSHDNHLECRAHVLFPLAPALSLRERENRGPVCRHTGAPRWFQNWNACLPLPRGEGWGEGEHGVGTGEHF